ncbi:hypothetical protein B0T26DRAFT_723585 [Lasiosphaeria miniovina]|uniref:Uncharacterized protein n=1 Tax=Lasiosphaeria miniovina TaxID=1954250 RepID=A0AA40A618_9PEZI|nr:uncharacterized protein B0T26DRAFT_723585 [Lasiosphaeria miniovina]KAK0709946.1 hypothetical protein B0T26DRAFT_723585 [Lasiosphaeria miniovina]
MAAGSSTAFPLQSVSAVQLRSLCQALWGWDLCSDCRAARPNSLQRCREGSCPWSQRSERLELFFDLYRDLTSSYVPDFFGDEDQALRSHEDLLDIIRLVGRNGAMLSRDECRHVYFATRSNNPHYLNLNAVHQDEQSPVPRSDQERAFDLASRVMTMVGVGCHDRDQDDHDAAFSGDGDEHGRRLLPPHFLWSPEKPLQVALADSFPTRVHPSLQDNDAQSKTIKSRLTAVNLTKIARLKMQGTSDLQHHLRLDQATGTVHVFHYTSVLKEHLLATKPLGLTTKSHSPEAADQEKTAQHTSGMVCLPRSLALETLYTMQLLFPRDDKSQALLRNLVSKHGFDPDCLRFGTAPFESRLPSSLFGNMTKAHQRRDEGDRDNIDSVTATATAARMLLDEKPQALRYPVWGSRLMDLFDEIENPKPRGALDAWLERRSKSRHVMLVTLAGVATAVVLGLLSLCVSIFQTWIAWKQWKAQEGTS